ncbi:MAG TPA: TonB-dependent receptor [Steroidobacteraceae bacterium]|nr:TonB-dependent receptor [Steroidobacteraceae bacterium]
MNDLNRFRALTLRAAIAAALGLAASPVLLAQETPADGDEEDIGEVVVTGTRVATRTRLDTLVPVDVLPQEVLTASGSTELAEALSTAAPSLNFPRPSITDGTDHIRPATLRGLAPDQTLVLVNSKRRHQSALVNVNGSVGRGSAAVDLNAIPLAAIETVEVLRDGASAQYGSDAIAGVINLRLRDAREGGNASLTYGQYDTEVETERGRRSEDDGATMTASGWVGLPLGAEGFLTLSGEYRDRDPTSRGDFDNRVPGSPVTSRYGDADVEDITAYVNAGVPLEGDWNIYGWAGYQQREGNSAAFPRIFNDARNVPAIYPNGFLPLITTDIDDLALGWGVRGNMGSWDADVSLVYGSNEVAYGVENSLNTSYGASSQTEFDAGAMKYDQLVFNAGIVRTFEVGGLPEGINVAFGIEARTESYSIEAGEPTSYDRGPVAGVAAGAQGFPGFQPSNELDEDREAYSVYADVEARLTEKFLASVAVRGEDYSDFGSAVTGKVAGRYDFTGSFALRGAISTGFRAPGLQQAFFTSTATNFINGVPFEVGTFPATSDVAITLGAQPLDAEESTNYSLGTVIRFGGFEATIDAYRIDIEDRIVLSENLNTPQVAALIAPFGANVARFFINGVDTKTEGIDLVTRYLWRTEKAGKFEFVAAGNWNDTEVEKVPSTNVIDNICVGQPAPCTPPVLFARNNTLSFEEGTPDSKVSLGVDWVVPLGATNFGVNLKGTRYGEVVEPGIPSTAEINAGVADARDLHVQPDWIVDLTLNAKLLEDKLSLSLGADNLFDQYPDRVPNNRVLPNPPGGTVNLNATNALGYSRYSPYGFNGRFLFARMAYHW